MINYIQNKIKKMRDQARRRNDFIKFKKLSNQLPLRFSLLRKNKRLIYEDSKETSFDTHYIYHPAWAARILAQIRPPYHVDISSKLDFSTIVSAFIPVRFYDYRPAQISLSNLTSEYADLLNLPFKDASIPSLSCMHVVEHIGLGRYGDAIDPEGDLKAMRELERVLSHKGTFLFVVPIGKPQIQFNAHRIYSYKQILEYFKDLTLKEFTLIPDNAQKVGLIQNASEDESNQQAYGCGCFWFIKP